MSGWEQYRAWDPGPLIGEHVAQSAGTDGLQVVSVRRYSEGVEVVVDDHAAAGSSAGEWTAPRWALVDGVGIHYERRGGTGSYDRREGRRRHTVMFSPGVPAQPRSFELADETRSVSFSFERWSAGS